MGSQGRLLLAATLLAALVAVPGMVLGRSVSPALAPETNTSIVLYKPPANGKPGRAVTGTLVYDAGTGSVQFTKKGAFSTRRWTSIAVGRDSMALYDKGTGKLVTGRFRNGIWKPVKSRTIAKGYTHVVASCDTILFYKRSTASGRTAEFTSGDIRDMRTFSTPLEDNSLLAASCDTLMALGAGTFADGLAGWLRYGHYQPNRDSIGNRATQLTANRSSFMQLFGNQGSWGQLRDGDRTFVDDALDFALWDVIAGTGDSILFYIRSTGLSFGSGFANGNYAGAAQLPSVGKGWRIIAGGK
jgi:hypothetical protein